MLLGQPFHLLPFSALTLLYKATGDNFDALALQMVEDGFLLHAMEFLDHCFAVVGYTQLYVQPRATKNLTASGYKSTWASIRVVKQHAALGFMQDCGMRI